MAAPGPGTLGPVGSVAHGAPASGAAGTNLLLLPTGRPSPDPEYIWARLSDAGNAALWGLCFTELQRQVWGWPSYDFLVKVKRRNGVLVPVIRVEQVSFHRTRPWFFPLFTRYSCLPLAPILPAVVR